LQINLPVLERFECDGNAEEWSKVEFFRLWANPLGGYPDSSDLKALLKVSWYKNNLVLLLDIHDQVLISDTINPWKSDAIEAFISPFRGSEYIFQISAVSLSGKDYIRINKYNHEGYESFFSGDIKSQTVIKGYRRITEIKIGISEDYSIVKPQRSLALQVYVDYNDSAGSLTKQVVWYPVGQSYNSSCSMFSIGHVDGVKNNIAGTSRLVITDNKKLSLFVFGAERGKSISIYRNKTLFAEYLSNHQCEFEPDSFDISSPDWDIENDSLFVFSGKDQISFHELFLAPRLYKTIEEKRFDREIRNFVYRDRQSPPPENATLFIGSSSIVRWETLKKDFPELVIIKRGFGGSNSQEALMYMNKIVLPYKPERIVYYEGDNDVAIGITPEEIQNNIEQFIDQVEISLPQTKIYILSPKPSINRMHLWAIYQRTNALLRELPKKHENVFFIDLASAMFNDKGILDKTLFVEDGIHLNEKGYALWTKILRNALESGK